MAQENEQKEQLSERNRRFLEDLKKARERFEKLPPEEREKGRKLAEEYVKRATLNGRIE